MQVNARSSQELSSTNHTSTVPPPPTSQPAPTESTTIPPTPVTEPTSEPSSPSTAPEHETMEHPFESNHHLNTNHLHLDKNLTFHKPMLLLILMRQTQGTFPNGLEAAETLAEALSQIKTKRRNVKTGVKEVDWMLKMLVLVSNLCKSKRRKAVLEETPPDQKNIREEQASLAEIAIIQAKDEAENTRRKELKRQDKLATKRLQEELELIEAQKKKCSSSRGLKPAQFYTEEYWDTIWAKLEANADLVKEIAGEDVSEADYAQRMVGF
ncbi:hypothetical protein Tco_0575570 [Tanacetum coccineum]